MFYPEEFKAKVRSVCCKDSDYPRVKNEVERLLAQGDRHLGSHLANAYTTSFSFMEILDAKSLEELQERAKEMKEIYELYLEWQKLFDEQEPR